MRDNLKSEQHFDKWINEFYQSLDRVTNWILTGKTAPERVNTMKQSMVQTSINLITCKYSSSKDITTLCGDLINAINLTHESWDGFWNVEYNGKKLNQYGLSAYDEMLWMLSLGYLFRSCWSTTYKINLAILNVAEAWSPTSRLPASNTKQTFLQLLVS
jgi:hypothetical protein